MKRWRWPSNSAQLVGMGGIWLILGATLGDGDIRGPFSVALGMACIIGSYLCDSIEKASRR